MNYLSELVSKYGTCVFFRKDGGGGH